MGTLQAPTPFSDAPWTNTPLPIFFSHRWLRTQGMADEHRPDGVDNPKARCLAEFGRWYENYWAAGSGMQVEVFLWIDYACVDQNPGLPHDAAIAALPLYIASCQAVVTWQTPDFDRRCWPMLERRSLQSYILHI